MAGSISIWGLGGGMINTQDLIDLELYSLEMKKMPHQNRKDDLTTLRSSYNRFKSELENFTNMLSSYSLYTGTGKTTTYSQEGFVSVNANSGAISGSYSIEITQLATHHQIQTKPRENMTEPLGGEGGTISINGTQIDITPEMSAADILQVINNAGAGVRAYSINNTMFMVSDTTGVESEIKLEDVEGDILATLGFTGEGVEKSIPPQGAEFKVNGVELTSDSNRVTGALPGVTMDLTRVTETGKPIEFTIGNDTTDDYFDKISEFVEGYNKALTTLNSFIGVDGALSGKSAPRALQKVLTSMFNFDNNGTRSFHLGITSDKTGVLTLDEEKLKEAIASNPDMIKDYFFGLSGVTNVMHKEMEKVFGTRGVVTNELDSIASQLSDIEGRIEDITQRNALLEEAIIARYADFEVRIGSLNTQLTMMQSLIESLNSSKKN